MTGSSRGPDGDRSAVLQPSEVSGKRGKGPRRREFHLRHFELQGLFTFYYPWECVLKILINIHWIQLVHMFQTIQRFLDGKPKRTREKFQLDSSC